MERVKMVWVVDGLEDIELRKLWKVLRSLPSSRGIIAWLCVVYLLVLGGMLVVACVAFLIGDESVSLWELFGFAGVFAAFAVILGWILMTETEE